MSSLETYTITALRLDNRENNWTEFTTSELEVRLYVARQQSRVEIGGIDKQDVFVSTFFSGNDAELAIGGLTNLLWETMEASEAPELRILEARTLDTVHQHMGDTALTDIWPFMTEHTALLEELVDTRRVLGESVEVADFL